MTESRVLSGESSTGPREIPRPDGKNAGLRDDASAKTIRDSRLGADYSQRGNDRKKDFADH